MPAEGTADPTPVDKTQVGFAIKIYDRDDWNGDPVKDIGKASDIEYFETFLDAGPGHGSFKMHAEDLPTLAGLKSRNVAKIFYDGRPVFAFRLERRRFERVTEGEHAGQWWTFSGEGLGGALADAYVSSEILTDDGRVPQLAPIERPFTFAAVNFIDTAWGTATSLATVPSHVVFRGEWDIATGYFTDDAVRNDGVLYRAVANNTGSEPPSADWVAIDDFAPEGWPDPSAEFIAATPAGSDPDDDFSSDNRMQYFRSTFTLSEIKLVTVFAAAYGDAEVFINGESVVTASGASDTANAQIRLPAATHTIAVKYRQRGDDEGVAVSVGDQTGRDGDGNPEYDWLVSTDDTWKAYAGYPPPGFTTGRVLGLLVNEGRTQAALYDKPTVLDQFILRFDDDVDTAGQPWSETIQRYWQHGDPLLSVLQELMESSCEARVSPNGRVKVWDSPQETDVSDLVSFEVGGNIVALSHDTAKGSVNHILARTADVWIERDRRPLGKLGEVLQHRCGFLSLSTVDSTSEAARIIRDALDKHGGPWESPTIEVIDPPEGPHPYRDFDLGYVVSAPDEDGDKQPHRIIGMGGRAANLTAPATFTMALEMVR